MAPATQGCSAIIPRPTIEQPKKLSSWLQPPNVVVLARGIYFLLFHSFFSNVLGVLQSNFSKEKETFYQ
ncbi:Uncharacterized protein TCM_027551 [Theobroma cacao]|uniref:Uncharacterized protein n=1 Tax=Theobroma cacao TaxID=3641 RepID=A0A061GGH3_THECC|nr:Uncharacterized protein TCM_027551 [Theobroma cacao]